MFLFISDVYGPESMEEFASRFRETLLGQFSGQGIVASIWGEHGVNRGYMIQGWEGEPRGTYEAFEGRRLDASSLVERVDGIVN
jgi:hypothetical protein